MYGNDKGDNRKDDDNDGTDDGDDKYDENNNDDDHDTVLTMNNGDDGDDNGGVYAYVPHSSPSPLALMLHYGGMQRRGRNNKKTIQIQ